MSDPLGRHVFGGRTEVDGHMCPAPRCGWPPYPFCLVCGGSGLVTEMELAVWQKRELDEHPEIERASWGPTGGAASES